MKNIITILLIINIWSCTNKNEIKPDYYLTADQKHNKFSSLIPSRFNCSVWLNNKGRCLRGIR